MTPRLEATVSSIVAVLEGWESVDAISMIQSGEDDLDPYYFLSFDVYATGSIPDISVRRTAFADAVAFEAAPVSRKDRFLIGNLPVRVEYKETRRFDELLAAAKSGVAVFRDDGTYAFYRLESADVLFERTDWMSRTRSELAELPEQFWSGLAAGMAARLEHSYGDVSAAVAREDLFFYLVSSASFIRQLCSLLFVLNRRFEPSARQLASDVRRLPLLPDAFEARFDTFLSLSGPTDPSQKRELAEMLIHDVLSLLSR